MHLAVVQTHPIQYYAPVYRYLHQRLGVSTTAIYATDAGARNYADREFGRSLQWDVDLLSGYENVVLGHGAPEQARVSGLRHALKTVSPDAVMLTGYAPRFNALAAATALTTGYPLMLRADASDVSHERGALKRSIRDQVLKSLYRRIQQFLYVGSNARDHFVRLGVDPQRLWFSPLSVPSDVQLRAPASNRARGEIRQELAIADDVSLVMFCGKLTRKKSPDHLLLAAALLPAQTRRRLAFAFVGDGPLASDLSELARQPGMPPVHLLGFKNQRALSAYYHACDALALPSLYQETWGLVINEAMMHGKPVVVSDAVGCGRDLVAQGSTGFVFARGDVPALRDALLQVLDLARSPEVAAKCQCAVAAYSTSASAEGIRDALQATLCNE